MLDALPSDEEDNNPDTMSIRSDSITEFAEWVSWRGTNANCEMFVEASKPESIVFHCTPSQYVRNGDDPSDERPPANTLLVLPLSTVTAVTGPGISPEEPTAVQVELSNANMATFEIVLSESEIDPEANNSS